MLLLVLAPLVNRLLRLDSLPTAALVAVASVPFTDHGRPGRASSRASGAGRRSRSSTSLSGVPRLVIGTALIWWRPSETAALLGTAPRRRARRSSPAGGSCAARATPASRSETHGFRRVIVETFRNSQVLLAFFALSNADVIVARNVLPEHDAGLYAGGLILTKAVLFLPQFVVVVAFPSMSTIAERRRALTAEPGARRRHRRRRDPGRRGAAPAGAGLRRRRTTTPRSPTTWLVFAVLGTVLSMLQLLVYSVLARQAHRSVYLVWLALVVLVGARPAHLGSCEQLLTVVLAVDAALLAVLLAAACAVACRPSRRAASSAECLSGQWAASCQLRPVPTDTSSGTVRSAAPPICCAHQRVEGLPLPRRHLEHELVVDLEQHP